MIVVRAMRPDDRPQAEAFWQALSPYRPGDESEAEAMYAVGGRIGHSCCKMGRTTSVPGGHVLTQLTVELS